MFRGAEAITSLSEELDHSMVIAEGKIAWEQSGGYAESLPCEKRPPSKASRPAPRMMVSSKA
jgi:hypothetical protein